MSMTQFAMVEELAFLVKDNLPCKHLVLTMEEALVNFLQDDTSSDGILELEPMNSYSRLLLHRLAEIFGFAHESVGEGDDRHLILERCPETSIPPILVSDILWQYDEPQPLVTSHQILRRKEVYQAPQTNTASLQHSLEQRKTAYLAARERIFSLNLEEVKQPGEQKPRSMPVVARRMIAHALGQRIHPKKQTGSFENNVEYGGLTDELHVQDKNAKESNMTADSEDSMHLRRNSNSRARSTNSSNTSSLNKRDDQSQTPVKKVLPHVSHNGKHGNVVDKDYMRKEHLGAARRMFAHALGVQSGKDGFVSRSSRIGEIQQKEV
ncbi:hypothetical protein L6164_010662 [Bauhinia variegata]|uniref:Uncharacterized protein n=1 Tax=Bauhinia variegata TaxID=167791 RepID=A0ACB9PNZ3_BAUVA|nr:hypothetical protein L6164_010662 [Bauhinia variegata]